MDKFVTVRAQKDSCTLTPSQIRYIHKIQRAGRQVCVYGDSGVGKTFLVRRALEGTSCIEVTTKGDFSETTATLFFDDVVYHEEVFSLGKQIVVSRKRLDDFPEYIEIQPLPDEEMRTIAYKYFEGDIDTETVTKARGNIRNFLTDLDISLGFRDEFPTPRDLVVSLMCRGHTGDPMALLGQVVPEHGYSCGIVHENYLDAEGSSLLDVAEWLSLADLQDENLYHGTASDTVLFSLCGILAPAIYVNHTLDDLRPGSAWTKFNNFKMRDKKVTSMTNRKVRAVMDPDSLDVLSLYCIKGHPDAISKLKSYGLGPADIDVMNHVVTHKMKPRQVQAIKKKLKESP